MIRSLRRQLMVPELNLMIRIQNPGQEQMMHLGQEQMMSLNLVRAMQSEPKIHWGQT
jgi:hypothetical protein